MSTVAITGVSGYIGSRLAGRLARGEPAPVIIGIDIKPPPDDIPGLKFYHQDVTEPLDVIFKANAVESAVHLAFMVKPTSSRAAAKQVDIGGCLNFLNACHKAGVKHLVYLSSHAVYGARKDNPSRIEETAPLRPQADFQYSEDKVETERLLGQYSMTHPDACLTILRACPVAGPGAAGSVAALMFKPPVMISVSGYDPELQFVHEEDAVEVMYRCLIERRGGTFNIAGSGSIRYHELARLADKKRLSVPGALLKLAVSASWKLHLQNDSPPSGLEFIKYPPLLSTARLTAETGYRFRYSTREAIAAYLHTKGE